uniref:Uncharacterized protein n=1 Tax=Rhizophora mucronata TaxID=61149 RepID=A0A2P2P7K6_RHIMU
MSHLNVTWPRNPENSERKYTVIYYMSLLQKSKMGLALSIKLEHAFSR